jgi:hypothetical protein
MSPLFTGILFGFGFGGFVYYKMMRQTGGNAKSSLIIGVLAALVGFFVIFSLFGILFSEK